MHTRSLAWLTPIWHHLPLFAAVAERYARDTIRSNMFLPSTEVRTIEHLPHSVHDALHDVIGSTGSDVTAVGLFVGHACANQDAALAATHLE
jgi:hypothetical protein